MKKKPPRKPARAKAKQLARLKRMGNKVFTEVVTRLRAANSRVAELTSKLNTANACVAKQIERINELTHERDEKQCTIDRLCRANAALHGVIETLKGQVAKATPPASLTTSIASRATATPPPAAPAQPASVTVWVAEDALGSVWLCATEKDARERSCFTNKFYPLTLPAAPAPGA